MDLYNVLILIMAIFMQKREKKKEVRKENIIKTRKTRIQCMSMDNFFLFPSFF